MIKSYTWWLIFALICIVGISLYYSTYACRPTEGMSILLNHDITNEEIYGESVNKDGYLDGIDVIYYINLDRSTVRRNDMDALFQDSVFRGIPTVRVAAYDGKREDMSTYFTIEKGGNAANTNNTHVSNIEYACLMSHLETIRTFSESPYDVALILEDDVTLDYKKFWKKTVREIIDGAPPDWDIIQLCFILDGDFPTKEYTLNHANNPNNYYSTAAYIINKSSAMNMNHIYRNHTYHLNHRYGHEADRWIFHFFTTYTYKIPYFTYKSVNFSTIHPEHEEIHQTSKKKVTAFLSSLSH